MAEHKINCPGCDQHLSVPEELAGQQIDCPSCSKPMTVPAFAEVEEEDEEWVEEYTPKSSKIIVGIAAWVAVLGVVAFIALGGDDSQEDEPELATPVGMTNEPPRSVPTPEITKEKDNEIEKIKERLAKGEPLDHYNEWGYTELFVAIEAEDVELVKRLLAAGADPNATERQGTSPLSFPTLKRTPLFSAVEIVSKELTELLVTNGANVNHKDGAGLTTTDNALMALSGEKDPDKALSGSFSPERAIRALSVVVSPAPSLWFTLAPFVTNNSVSSLLTISTAENRGVLFNVGKLKGEVP